MKIERQKVLKVMVLGCDGCKKEINAGAEDEVVQVFYRRLGVKENRRKIWKTMKQESYHKGCYMKKKEK